MAMFSPFGDYNDDGTPKRATSSGFTPGQRVAPQSQPTTAPPVRSPDPTTTNLPPPPVPPPDGSVTPRVVPLGPTSRQPPVSATPAAPPAYRAPPPPSATGDYDTDSRAFQGWMDSYGRFDPEVTSGRAGYRPPAPPASSATQAAPPAGWQSLPAASSAPPQLPPQAAPTAMSSRFQDAMAQYSDEFFNNGGLVDTSNWTPADFQAAVVAAGGNNYSPLTVGTPGSASANSFASAAISKIRHPPDPAAEAQRAAENNALRAAFTASMGQLTSGPMSTPVSNPAEVAARFAQSGYTGAQALADGWGTGTGLPGWMGQSGYWNQLDPQGRMGAPYVNQGPIVPPTPPPAPSASPVPPAAPPPAPPGADPYHPPGYTPGVAANALGAPPVPPPPGPPPTVPGAPVVDTMRPRAPAPPMRQPYNPTATPNIPGQPVTDFTYPVTGPPRAPGPRFGQPGQRRGLSRRTGRDIGGNG